MSFLTSRLKNATTLLLTLCLATVLSSCGWQLRGQHQPPAAYKVLTLNSSLSDANQLQLSYRLNEGGWIVKDTPADSQALLNLDKLNIRQRTQTINSAGEVAEYELVGQLTGQLVSQHGDVTPISITTQVWYDNDVTRVAATQLEKEARTRELVDKLFNLLILRLQSVDN